MNHYRQGFAGRAKSRTCIFEYTNVLVPTGYQQPNQLYFFNHSDIRAFLQRRFDFFWIYENSPYSF
ncbi:DUF4176 domain-containing protein [Streptococcus panodentis]|uniref:DUF4176 domain-containing protein n=1 Tax=Streptococcus panodentis TaxID=1581472 RepID=UPI001AE8A5E2